MADFWKSASESLSRFFYIKPLTSIDQVWFFQDYLSVQCAWTYFFWIFQVLPAHHTSFFPFLIARWHSWLWLNRVEFFSLPFMWIFHEIFPELCDRAPPFNILPDQISWLICFHEFRRFVTIFWVHFSSPIELWDSSQCLVKLESKSLESLFYSIELAHDPNRRRSKSQYNRPISMERNMDLKMNKAALMDLSTTQMSARKMSMTWHFRSTWSSFSRRLKNANIGPTLIILRFFGKTFIPGTFIQSDQISRESTKKTIRFSWTAEGLGFSTLTSRAAFTWKILPLSEPLPPSNYDRREKWNVNLANASPPTFSLCTHCNKFGYSNEIGFAQQSQSQNYNP